MQPPTKGATIERRGGKGGGGGGQKSGQARMVCEAQKRFFVGVEIHKLMCNLRIAVYFTIGWPRFSRGAAHTKSWISIGVEEAFLGGKGVGGASQHKNHLQQGMVAARRRRSPTAYETTFFVPRQWPKSIHTPRRFLAYVK